MAIERMFLGQLVEAFVPKDQLGQQTINEIKKLQAALLIAHETGVDTGKKSFERIRPMTDILKDLEAAQVSSLNEIYVASQTRIGVEPLPRDVPAFGDLLASPKTGISGTLPAGVKNALLAYQAAARLEAILTRGETFFKPRYNEQTEPAYLVEVQKAVEASLLAQENKVEITPEEQNAYRVVAARARAGANQVWQSFYGQDLIPAGGSSAPSPSPETPKP
ncbi:MAG: hypothetical protein J0L77_00645 [Alphaproteobacteria bacterium]|nr:hypothetical protein [Alphaproteobacteria bacterium]